MSTLGQIIGGIIGGVVGFIYGGPVGAFYGFSIGYGLGSIIDPVSPDVPQPGDPMGELDMMTNEEGSPLPDVIGTTKLTGNLLYYGNNRRVDVTEEVDSGGSSGSGGSETVVTGYRYYLSWAMGFCIGPVDALYTVYFDDKIVWAGSLPLSYADKGKVTLLLAEGDKEDLFAFIDNYEGYDDLYEEMYGSIPDFGGKPVPPTSEFVAKLLQSGNYVGLMHFYFGTNDQEVNPWLEELMLNEGAIQDTTMSIPYRRQCYAYMDDCFIGEYNRCPTVKLVLRKSPECSFDT